MDHPRNEELISAYLDRELSPDERAALDRILEKSPEARERLRELEATSQFLRRLPQCAPEADFADAVVERLRSESLLRPLVVEPPRPKRGIIWRISAPLAAAAALLMCVWLIRYEPHRTAVNRSLERDTEAESVVDAVALAGRNQLEEVGAFDVLGPDGESRFQLIVFTKASDSDALRCILVGKGETAGLAQETTNDFDGVPAGSGQLTHALQADQEQIDALAKAYIQANSHVDEEFPVVDIFASLAPQGLTVGRITSHTRSRAPASSAAPVGDGPSLAETTKAKELRSLVAPAEPRPPSRFTPPVAADRERTADRSSKDADSTAVGRTRDMPEDEEGRGSQDGAAGLATRSAPVQATPERVQTTFKIERVQVQTADTNTPGGLAGRDVESARKKPSVGRIADSTTPRISRHAAPTDKQPPGRLQVLLYFEPEKSAP